MEAARALGREMASRNVGLVYGGGNVGLMGAIAHSVADHHPEGEKAVIGVIPESLMDREVSGMTVGEVRVVQTMHERKAAMAELCDGFVTLPGGFGCVAAPFFPIILLVRARRYSMGPTHTMYMTNILCKQHRTMEEIMEAITWLQLGYHTKPVAFYNVYNFYDKLLEFFDGCVSAGFVRPQTRAIVLSDTDPAALLDKMAAFVAPPSVIALAKSGELDVRTRG